MSIPKGKYLSIFTITPFRPRGLFAFLVWFGFNSGFHFGCLLTCFGDFWLFCWLVGGRGLWFRFGLLGVFLLRGTQGKISVFFPQQN